MNLEFSKESGDILLQILHNRELKESINELLLKAEETYVHSFKVALLSIDIGISLGYSKEDLYLLGSAALLHDIGVIKYEDLESLISFTDQRSLRNKSYRYVKEKINISNLDKIIIRCHEFNTSNPCPRKGKDRRNQIRFDVDRREKDDIKIRAFSQIIGICDMSSQNKRGLLTTDISHLIENEFSGDNLYKQELLKRLS